MGQQQRAHRPSELRRTLRRYREGIVPLEILLGAVDNYLGQFVAADQPTEGSE